MKTRDEGESFAAHKTRKKKGSQGKASETQVQGALTKFKAAYSFFDFDRLPDTRSAGTLMPAQVCDCTVFCRGQAYSLEVKEISKGFRLPKFVQMPRMLRREKVGVPGIVLVHFLEKNVWVAKGLNWFDTGDASWDLTPTKATDCDYYGAAEAALRAWWSI